MAISEAFSSTVRGNTESLHFGVKETFFPLEFSE